MTRRGHVRAQLYRVFVIGSHKEIALFGPASFRAQAFRAAAGTGPSTHIYAIMNADDLLPIETDVPLVLLPLWWRESASSAVISAAHRTERDIFTAFDL
ncbi:MAG: hypothetical protein M3Z31_12795 [Pseudomonadota bacterium]|nr:hypothetical protein [Pseudomonadota bacterium]